jgi:hypothetical protein
MKDSCEYFSFDLIKGGALHKSLLPIEAIRSLDNYRWYGKYIPPHYSPPAFDVASTAPAGKGEQISFGGCHCGAVRIAMKAK